MKRALYLVAYDIAHPKRLRRVLKMVKAHASQGQKSAYELWLSAVEKQSLLIQLNEVIHVEEDRLSLIRISASASQTLLGQELPSHSLECLYVG